MKLFWILLLIPCSAFSQIKNDPLSDNVIINKADGSSFHIYSKTNRFNFENYSDSIKHSPNKKLTMVHKLEVGVLYGENGEEIIREKAYCDIINASTGCVIGTYDGEICGGNWDKNSNLRISSGTFNVPQKTEQLVPKDLSTDLDYQDLDFSIQSYMACYPINTKNSKYYKEISEKLSTNYDRKADSSFIKSRLFEL